MHELQQSRNEAFTVQPQGLDPEKEQGLLDSISKIFTSHSHSHSLSLFLLASLSLLSHATNPLGNPPSFPFLPLPWKHESGVSHCLHAPHPVKVNGKTTTCGRFPLCVRTALKRAQLWKGEKQTPQSLATHSTHNANQCEPLVTSLGSILADCTPPPL